MRFTFDMALEDEAPPEPGDVLVAARVAYRVTSVRPVESRVWPNRWALGVDRLGEHGGQPPAPAHGGRRWHTGRYRRGETPAQHFRRVRAAQQ